MNNQMTPMQRIFAERFTTSDTFAYFSTNRLADVVRHYAGAVTSETSPGAYSLAIVAGAMGDEAVGLIVARWFQIYYETYDPDAYDPREVGQVVKAMCRVPRLSTIRMATLMLFFGRLMNGEYFIENKPTARRIFQLLMKNADRLRSDEWDLIRQEEERRRSAELQAYETEAVTWKEHCRRSGVNPQGLPLDQWIEDQVEKEGKKIRLTTTGRR